uniref:SFRICE_029638 n=1 Tax=Spodoptera frugiperda TaxID=7108 RepID=A0A2H1V816_SPOFR
MVLEIGCFRLKVLMGFFRFFENFSAVAWSLELCPVYGNRPATLRLVFDRHETLKTLILLLFIGKSGIRVDGSPDGESGDGNLDASLAHFHQTSYESSSRKENTEN